MRNEIITVGVVLFCAALAIGALGQTETCGGPAGVCPPTGTSMGQSDYQRTQPPNVSEPAAPTCVSTTPMTPAESTAPQTTPYAEPSVPAATGLGPLTPSESSRIAVDERYIYVLQGDEVVKIDKNDLRVVARTKITQPAR